MDIPQIPETASDEYLEELRERIFVQLERAKSEKVRQQLRAFLKAIQQKKQQRIQQRLGTQVLKKSAQASAKWKAQKQEKTIQHWLDVDVPRVDTKSYELEQKEREQSQERAETDKQAEAPQEQPHEKEKKQTQPVNLSRDQQEAVKTRLKETLRKIYTQQVTNEEERSELPPAEKTGEARTPELVETKDRQGFAEKEQKNFSLRLQKLFVEMKLQKAGIPDETRTRLSSVQQRLHDQMTEEAEQEKALRQKIEQQKAAEKAPQRYIGFEVRPEDIPEGELPFEEACQKVKAGESLGLLYKAGLTRREKEMLWAVEGYLKELKGLKRQQTFDLQHLTAKSIRELEQIFKTYQPQGYMNVELHNVYNRLLTLRSRFSILLH